MKPYGYGSKKEVSIKVTVGNGTFFRSGKGLNSLRIKVHSEVVKE